MKKFFLRIATVLFLANTLYACSDDKSDVTADIENEKSELASLAPTHFVVNQGNMYNGIAGSVTAINYSTEKTMNGVFSKVNGYALGDTPQNLFRQDSRCYVAVFGSNLVWVIDVQTMQVLSKLSVKSPQRVTADAYWIYVASNEGFVTRFNAKTFAEDNHIEVGPNPMGVTLANGDLYVSVSDSYNWDGGMANGKKVKRVDIKTWKEEASIEVGLNPTRLEATADGYVVCVCNGFFDAEQYVYRISPDNISTKICYGSDCVVAGNNAYVAYSVTDWDTFETTCTISLCDITNGTVLKENIMDKALNFSPSFLAYDTVRALLIMGRRANGSDYTATGTVEFYGTDGKLAKSFPVGVEPYSVVWL